MPTSNQRTLATALDRLRETLQRWGLLPQPILRPVPVRTKHRRVVRKRGI